MMGQTGVLEKSVKCTSAVATAFTFAKFGADDDTADLATAATDGIMGILQHTTATAGDIVRLMLVGISRLKLGGTVTRGKPVTSDASGKGVQATAGQSYGGIAFASGVSGDIIPVFVLPVPAV